MRLFGQGDGHGGFGVPIPEVRGIPVVLQMGGLPHVDY